MPVFRNECSHLADKHPRNENVCPFIIIVYYRAATFSQLQQMLV